jgi:mRNA interferase MazF
VVSRPARRDEVWLVNLDATLGAEMQKTRPCLIVSPDIMNEFLLTALVAPLTTAIRPYPTRVRITFKRKPGQVALDQMRAIDRRRLLTRLGRISETTAREVAATLVEMFTRG